MIESELKDIPRISFHMRLVRAAAPENAIVADIGGGLGLFSPGCAAIGMNVTLVDDFGDSNYLENRDAVLQLHREFGVRIESCDVIRDTLGFQPASLDAIACFDSMEHWHASPKKLFHNLLSALKPGGTFLLSCPNCADLKKRISVPLGFGKWTQMEHWYEPEIFRGHVREPDVDDLRYIARDLRLTDVRIFGKNWSGPYHPMPLRLLIPLADKVLQLKPSLCSDIYLLGRKPH
jgi:SAM-dependent methyltransferase